MKVSVFISFMSKARVILSIVTACSSLIVVPIPLVLVACYVVRISFFISSMNRALVILSSVCSSSSAVHISLVLVAYLVERF